MKKTVQRTSKFKAFWGMLALVLVLGAGLLPRIWRLSAMRKAQPR